VTEPISKSKLIEMPLSGSPRLNPAAAEAFGEGGFSLIFDLLCDIRIFNG
jgi:hypothetical protein